MGNKPTHMKGFDGHLPEKNRVLFLGINFSAQRLTFGFVSEQKSLPLQKKESAMLLWTQFRGTFFQISFRWG